MADEIKNENKLYVKGWLTGFLFNFVLGVFLLVVGCFYITPNMLSKTFRVKISTGNQDLDNMAIYELVPELLSWVSMRGDLSIRDIETKSGYVIPVEGKLVDILKDTKLSNLNTALTDTLMSVRLNDLTDYIDIGGLEDYSLTYYLRDGLLYRDITCSELAEFEYEIDNNLGVIMINGDEVAELNSEVEIEVGYIPISKLPSEISSKCSNLTIGDIKSFKITLPAIISKLSDDTRLEDICSAVLDLTVGDLRQELDLPLLSILDQNGKLKDIDHNLSNAVMTKTLRELNEAGIIDLDVDMDKVIPYINIKLGDITLEMISTYLKLL